MEDYSINTFLCFFFIIFGWQIVTSDEMWMETLINKLYRIYRAVSFKEQEETEESVVTQQKYEDKYLDKYNQLDSIEISKERAISLKQNILFENTPLGNILMFYDSSRESFIYYSDHTVPYRFLETVGRKYVTMNNCKCLFVDMNEEINKTIDDTKPDDAKPDDAKPDEPALPAQKDVFAKLKNYNTDSSLQSKNAPTKKNDVKIHIKLHTNRYSHEGKLVNFSFLKKVERKVVDKNYSIGFAEFKKMKTR